MVDEQAYVRVTDLVRDGWSRRDAERLHRRAARKHGVYKPGERYTYVTREAINEAIQEAKVQTT